MYRVTAFSIAVLFLTAGLVRAADIASESDTYQKTVTPLLQKYCYECHGDGKHKADLALDSYKSVDDVLKGREKWEAVLRNVQAHDMPPEDASATPTQEEREVLTSWIKKELYKVDPEKPDPGRVTIHRLNRAEYNNTIRDLVGVDFQPAADFPPDDSGYGFDNIGDVLSLPPVLMEKYLSAADKILDEAIPTEPIKSTVRHFPASLAQVGFNAIGDRGDGWIQLISLEEDDVAVEVPVTPGEYLVRVKAFCKPTGGQFVGGGNNSVVVPDGQIPPTRISIMVNNGFVQDFALATSEAEAGVYEARVGVAQGKQRFRAVVRRIRGAANDLTMTNGRLGKQQPGIAYVKYIELEGPLPAANRRFVPAQLESHGEGKNLPSGTRLLDHNGDISTKLSVTNEGDYTLRAQAYADQAGDQAAFMQFLIDGKPIQTFNVAASGYWKAIQGQRIFSPMLLVPTPAIYETKVHLTPGEHVWSAAFINDYVDDKMDNPNWKDRNLYIDYLEFSDPTAPARMPDMPPQMQKLFASHPASSGNQLEAARQIVNDFTRRAWRRPITAQESDRLMKLYTLADSQGESFEGSVKLALKGALVSPHFLFRGELQPDPNNPNVVHEIDEFALASRLSYFLWSSTPDDELLNLAAQGELRKNLEAQVRRMLASDKANALVDNFAAQWLQTRELTSMQPDKELFPDYDPVLCTSMQKETELFFQYVMRNDRSVLDFLTGDYTFVNEKLATLYGIEGVSGEQFQKVSLADTPRRGVLTQASVLTLTSNPTRTSPVKRGKWVLENILGTPPPPPPPNVPPLEKEGQKLTGTLRQQMEQHRVDPNCASCHARMDPIGFGLENFDAIGAWREKDGESPIDSTGVLTTGESFKGATGLTQILAGPKQEQFITCLSEKMLTYALGRGIEYYDRPAVDKIVAGMKQDDMKFSRLILEVVNSLPFQMRRGEGDRSETAQASAK
jgi:hypothetical protein